MGSNIILVAETGSDLPAELAARLGIRLIPMHVAMGEQTLDDGTFPPEEVCNYYNTHNRKVPTTSGSTPYDFESVYEEIFSADPEARVLHLAYSAVTTCSYHSSELAIEDKPYQNRVRLVDTKHVSVGQAAVVLATKQWLDANPDATLEEAAQAAIRIGLDTRMCFVPNNLDYLRAGGRVSNAAAMVGNLLHLHPCIEIQDGRLIACKKYRGDLAKVAPQLLKDFAEKNQLNKSHIYFIHSPHMDPRIRTVLDDQAAALGFEKVTWLKTGCVITCHGGPGAFGIVGTV